MYVCMYVYFGLHCNIVAVSSTISRPFLERNYSSHLGSVERCSDSTGSCYALRGSVGNCSEASHGTVKNINDNKWLCYGRGTARRACQ